MQTFLPTSDFRDSARLLDYKRLGKQRVEGMQLLNAMQPDYDKKGWLNHPAKKMWEGYEDALKQYVNTMIAEWKQRGYNNTMKFYDVPLDYKLPPWLGNNRIHKSHRMNLLRKDFQFYSQHWPEEAIAHANDIESYPYYWPTSNGWYISTPDRSGTRPLEEGI
jgi:hypothetical protein|tara:strand:+ start:484 stop:972 length:489 start_codon:yes stop_codon:yes gene_type:complete